MKSELIIYHTNSARFLTRTRDVILHILCWGMWAAVIAAVINGCEWDDLGTSLQYWSLSQLEFLRVVQLSFHVPSTYFLMMMSVVSGFFLWSMANLALAPLLRQQRATAPLSLEAMARHFHLDLALVLAMQQERQILVFNTKSGDVMELRGMRNPVLQQWLEA